MSTTPETVPTVWTVDDEHFFRVVADVFAPAILLGGAVLLGSYDPEPSTRLAAPAAVTHPARTEPAATWPLAA
jgi:hypothetical protein